jgi:CRISPR-associated protein (TIGR02584 family)
MRHTRSETGSARPEEAEVVSAPLPDPVLMAVMGISPAILTETIWALAHEPEPIIPRRVIAVTTLEGRKRVERLFTPLPRFGGRAPWDALRDALAAKGIDVEGRLRFGGTPDDLRVITAWDAASGRTRELADLRSAADNESAAEYLLDQVRQVVENPDTQLIASVAGGRKTMGALLYACLTLAGRETDRLTHVLVNEPYESLSEFYFPGQPGGRLPHGEVAVAPEDARLELADVPFVPLRNLFRRELGRPAGGFSRLMESCREEVRARAGKSLRLTVETRHCRLDVNGCEVASSPREHVLLLFLARRAAQGMTAFPDYKAALDHLDAYRQEICDSRPKADLADWRHNRQLNDKFDAEDVRKLVSSLRLKLRRGGGDAALLAACLPERGRFSLELEPGMVVLK